MFKEVLLVDDDPTCLLIGERLIRKEELAERSVRCVNGQQAIDYLKRLMNDGKDLPELILLDLNMPVMNGWEFMAEFQEIKAELKTLPRIMILSSSPDPEEKVRALLYHEIVDFISKPMYAATMQAIMTKLRG